MTDRTQRTRELTRMCRSSLVAIIRRQGRIIATAYPLEQWSKDDLINEVLRVEFGEKETLS